MSTSLRHCSHVGYHTIDVEPEVTTKYRLGRVSLLLVGCLVVFALGPTHSWWDWMTTTSLSYFRVVPMASSSITSHHVAPSIPKRAKKAIMATPLYENQPLPVFDPILTTTHHEGQSVGLPRPQPMAVAWTPGPESPTLIKAVPLGLPPHTSTVKTLLQWMAPSLAVASLFFAAVFASRRKVHDLVPQPWRWAMAASEALIPGQKKPFPSHWGGPPKIQTKDFRKWPEGYGSGSGTVATWIEAKLKLDAASKALEVDSEYPGTAVARMKAIRARVQQLTEEELSGDWDGVRRMILEAGGLKDLPTARPGEGYTGHSFADWNHCDLTAMLDEETANENQGQVEGIAVGNQLGPGIKVASLPELGPGGSWSTCIMGCDKDPPADVAHLQFRSRIAFKLVWSPANDFGTFVLVDDDGRLLVKGTPTGTLPHMLERQQNYRTCFGSKYAEEADKIAAQEGSAPGRVIDKLADYSKMNVIEAVHARQILDPRGNPTIEVDVTLSGGVIGCAAVPSGASTGEFEGGSTESLPRTSVSVEELDGESVQFADLFVNLGLAKAKGEAVELRDGDMDVYGGKGVLQAVANINDIIGPALQGMSSCSQTDIDNKMKAIDGKDNKGTIGANGILGVSMAVARACAQSQGIPLYQYIAQLHGNEDNFQLPVPMANIINGGKHADNKIDFQEYMIVPVGASSFSEGLRWITEVFHTLKQLLQEDGHATSVGDESGFAPDLSNNEALNYVVQAVQAAGYEPGRDIAIALDCAASELFDEGTIGDRKGYKFWKSDPTHLHSADDMTTMYSAWLDIYPIVSIEDPLDQSDWSGYVGLTEKIGHRTQVVGDDLFVTNPKRFKKGVDMDAGNAILIKVNQIGTITETLEFIKMAQVAGFGAIASHGSGETEDTFIADLAVGTGCGQIKAGSLSRSDRVAKYNQLLRIEEELGPNAKWDTSFLIRDRDETGWRDVGRR